MGWIWSTRAMAIMLTRAMDTTRGDGALGQCQPIVLIVHLNLLVLLEDGVVDAMVGTCLVPDKDQIRYDEQYGSTARDVHGLLLEGISYLGPPAQRVFKYGGDCQSEAAVIPLAA